MVAEQDFFERYGFDGSADYDLNALLPQIWQMKKACRMCCAMSNLIRRCVPWWATLPMSNIWPSVNYALLGNAGEFLDPVFLLV